MAAVSLLGSTINTTAGAKSVTATPAAGDLIVICVLVSYDTSWTAPTDNQSGTYTKIGSTVTTGGTSHMLALYVRNALIPSATSTIFTLANPSADTGGGLAVIKVTGMSKAGSSAVRQSKHAPGNAGSGGSAPATGNWTSSKLTTNPVIGVVVSESNPPALAPTGGYSELLDTGYATPTVGIEIQSRNSGDTTNTMTWGSASGADWGCIGVELDASSPGTNFFLKFGF